MVKISELHIGEPKLGDRVLVIGRAWKGYIGTFASLEFTLLGEMARVELDNGIATLISIDNIRLVTK